MSEIAEAKQWDGTRASIEEIAQWANADVDLMDDFTLEYGLTTGADVFDVRMATCDGDEVVSSGDWIIRDTAGEFHLCRTVNTSAHTNGRIAGLEAELAEAKDDKFYARVELNADMQWKARAEKAEATIARVERAIAEGPLHRLDFPTSEDPYGIERQSIRVALDGGGDGCVAERG